MPAATIPRSTNSIGVSPADDAVLRAAFRYYYLSSRQVCRLLYSPGSLTYVQTKLKQLPDTGRVSHLRMAGRRRNEGK